MSVTVSNIWGGKVVYVAPEEDGEITDNFESYSEGNLNGQGNWIQITQTMAVVDISGNKVVSGGSDEYESCAGYDETIDDDQYAEVTIIRVVVSDYLGPAVRCQGATSGTYYGYYADGGERYLFTMITGDWTQIATADTGVSTDDVLKIEAEGTTIRCYLNGSLDTGLTGGTGVFTDSSISSGGIPGICNWGSSGATRTACDDFKAGEI